MSSWGTQRRNTILFIVILIIVILIFLSIFSYLKKPSTCSDGRRNGGEYGVDCGGPCDLLCNDQVVSPLIHWVRQFEVVPGVYNTVAYIENQNVSAGTENAEYVFKLFDKDGVLLEERKGSIDIRPKEIIPIVESNLRTGQLESVRVSFDFLNDMVWKRKEMKDNVLMIKNERLLDIGGLPRITAEITNTSINRVEDVSVVVIVYDINGNAITTSRTVVEHLNKGETSGLVYTWPRAFSEEISRFEIIPLYELPI